MLQPEPANETRQKHKSCRAMPRIQVTVSQIGEETTEARNATGDKRPPRPWFMALQREFGQPKVQKGDRDQRSTKTDAVMNHKMHDAAFVDTAKFFRCHLQKLYVMRQKVSGERLKNCEQARQCQADSAK